VAEPSAPVGNVHALIRTLPATGRFGLARLFVYGTLRNSVQVVQDVLNQLTVTGDIIGTVANPITISAPDGVFNFKVTGNVTGASSTSPVRLFSPAYLRDVEVNGNATNFHLTDTLSTPTMALGDIIIDGNFSGEIRARNLNAPNRQGYLWVGNDLSGRIELTEGLFNGSGATFCYPTSSTKGEKILVGHSVLPGTEFVFPAPGHPRCPRLHLGPSLHLVHRVVDG
jgi:hypothetical protein